MAYHLQRYDAPPKLQQHFQAPPRQLLPGRQRLWQPTPASQHLNWPNAQGWSFLIASWLPERPSKLANAYFDSKAVRLSALVLT
ncbi:hypothetical protein, partial [Loigolactobacillus bifermentans]|uniref:hypothetical protein n=1 Tax=Loigolactobacillus bifermentans TaxID=1607 RepID=UPI0012EE38B1